MHVSCFSICHLTCFYFVSLSKQRWCPMKNPQRSASSPSTSTSTVTHFHYPSFQRRYCFYCQDVKLVRGNPEHHITCSSSDAEQSIKTIVSASNDEMWKVKMADIIAEGDFLSRDIKYHKCYQTTYRHKHIQVEGPRKEIMGPGAFPISRPLVPPFNPPPSIMYNIFPPFMIHQLLLLVLYVWKIFA